MNMINTISGIKIQKFSPNLGAIITDVDLSKGVNAVSYTHLTLPTMDSV